MRFRVDLEDFRGPLDLLLYLVRKHEVEIADIPIASITDQFLEHMSVLEQLDINLVGDFLEMATTLVELKSRVVLPRPDEVESEIDDPKQELVQKLLEYKKYRDAATMLDERGRSWQERFPRLSDDLPTRERNLVTESLREVELWDLVSAFGRVVREHTPPPASNIVYDDTPIHVYMTRMSEQLHAQGQLAFGNLFAPGMHKSTMIGIFLALLELVRHHQIHAEQDDLFGEIVIAPGESSGKDVDLTKIDNYDPHAGNAPDPDAADPNPG